MPEAARPDEISRRPRRMSTDPTSRTKPFPSPLGPAQESLQAYASRTGRSVVDAYEQWHAQSYGPRECAAVIVDERMRVQLRLEGYGPGLGLTPGDVRALDLAAKRRAEKLRP
jgi:hypothetical protein